MSKLPFNLDQAKLKKARSIALSLILGYAESFFRLQAVAWNLILATWCVSNAFVLAIFLIGKVLSPEWIQQQPPQAAESFASYAELLRLFFGMSVALIRAYGWQTAFVALAFHRWVLPARFHRPHRPSEEILFRGVLILGLFLVGVLPQIGIYLQHGPTGVSISFLGALATMAVLSNALYLFIAVPIWRLRSFLFTIKLLQEPERKTVWELLSS